MKEKIMIAMLVLVAILLAVNLIVSLNGPRAAQADIVSGKNFFSTHSPDGTTVYLWAYQYTGTGLGAKPNMKYFGQVSAGGEFIPAK